MSRSASVLARPVLASYSRLAVAAMRFGLVAGLADHALAVLAGLGHHPVGLRLGVGKQPVGFGARVVDQRIGLGGGRGHHRVGVILGFAQQRVTGVEDVLGVVELAGYRVLDVVDQLEDIAAGHHAACRHRHAAGFFDDRAQLVERFKNSVHGNTLQA